MSFFYFGDNLNSIDINLENNQTSICSLIYVFQNLLFRYLEKTSSLQTYFKKFMYSLISEEKFVFLFQARNN